MDVCDEQFEQEVVEEDEMDVGDKRPPFKNTWRHDFGAGFIPETMKKNADRWKQRSTEYDKEGRNIIHSPPRRDMSTRDRYDYEVVATTTHAYWFTIYENPWSHDTLDMYRASSAQYNEHDQFLIAAALSSEELSVLREHLVGLEIIRHHRAEMTLGVVVQAEQDSKTGSIYVLVRPYHDEHGCRLVRLLEFGGMKGCSLAHARLDNIVQLHEISVCSVGARPGTWLWNTVELIDPGPIGWNSRYYCPPVYRVHKSSAGGSGHTAYQGRGAKLVELPVMRTEGACTGAGLWKPDHDVSASNRAASAPEDATSRSLPFALMANCGHDSIPQNLSSGIDWIHRLQTRGTDKRGSRHLDFFFPGDETGSPRHKKRIASNIDLRHITEPSDKMNPTPKSSLSSSKRDRDPVAVDAPASKKQRIFQQSIQPADQAEPVVLKVPVPDGPIDQTPPFRETEEDAAPVPQEIIVSASRSSPTPRDLVDVVTGKVASAVAPPSPQTESTISHNSVARSRELLGSENEKWMAVMAAVKEREDGVHQALQKLYDLGGGDIKSLINETVMPEVMQMSSAMRRLEGSGTFFMNSANTLTENLAAEESCSIESQHKVMDDLAEIIHVMAPGNEFAEERLKRREEPLDDQVRHFLHRMGPVLAQASFNSRVMQNLVNRKTPDPVDPVSPPVEAPAVPPPPQADPLLSLASASAAAAPGANRAYEVCAAVTAKSYQDLKREYQMQTQGMDRHASTPQYDQYASHMAQSLIGRTPSIHKMPTMAPSVPAAPVVHAASVRSSPPMEPPRTAEIPEPAADTSNMFGFLDNCPHRMKDATTVYRNSMHTPNIGLSRFMSSARMAE